jgi:hypothetical protein
LNFVRQAESLAVARRCIPSALCRTSYADVASFGVLVMVLIERAL